MNIIDKIGYNVLKIFSHRKKIIILFIGIITLAGLVFILASSCPFWEEKEKGDKFIFQTEGFHETAIEAYYSGNYDKCGDNFLEVKNLFELALMHYKKAEKFGHIKGENETIFKSIKSTEYGALAYEKMVEYCYALGEGDETKANIAKEEARVYFINAKKFT